MRLALYPGTFDPITYGHLDIVQRALKLFDRLIVAVADSPWKQRLFSLEERLEMVREAVKGWDRVSVEVLEGLLVDKVRRTGACAVVRGLRAVMDFEYEFEMALTNRTLNPELETVFLMTSMEYIYLRSSLVKEVAALGGDVSRFVPPFVERKLREKLGGAR
ncbi:MAG: pantetheine-phosphate adenylyltransferase [Candidatus Latescibacterota bacterium]|mgnify:CR=1 FL=1|nr:MAG: pantetheine-phosphate adenylyltransferase [Candidatus Latescibacterota bacterium]